MIEVSGVTSTYGKGAHRYMVLDNVSFSIPDKTSIAIIGKSGSGKSSLIHVMSGLARPEFGKIIINGRDILRMKQANIDLFRLKSMGFIFQAFYVQNNQTCAKNVSLPLEILGTPRKQREKLIAEALNAVGLLEKRHVKARDLSGGQKQRLAIARALINRPQFLFADEPTGNLDEATGRAIEDLLFWYNRTMGATLIIVTHDPDFAKKCDMQVTISDGKVASIVYKGQQQPLGLQLADRKQQFAAAAQAKVQQTAAAVAPLQPGVREAK